MLQCVYDSSTKVSKLPKYELADIDWQVHNAQHAVDFTWLKNFIQEQTRDQKEPGRNETSVNVEINPFLTIFNGDIQGIG